MKTQNNQTVNKLGGVILLLNIVTILVVTSCDKPNDETETTVKKLHISEFQNQANFWTIDEAEEMVSQSILNKQNSTNVALGITSSTAIVPLVFDEEGYLYEAIKFAEKVEEIIASEDENEEPTIETPPVYFTDFETYAMVAGDKLSLEKRIIPINEKIEGQSDKIFYIFDPYRRDDVTNGRDEDHNIKKYSKTTSVPPNANTQVGDVIIGWRTDGTSFGHTGGVVYVAVASFSTGFPYYYTFQGGDLYHPNTLTMEAVGYRFVDDDEIVMRYVGNYFIDNNVTKLKVRRRNGITIDQQNSVADYQMGKDTKTYSLLTPKWSGNAFYCSKLQWRAYKKRLGINIDNPTCYGFLGCTTGYYVTPNDIREDNSLTTIYSYNR